MALPQFVDGETDLDAQALNRLVDASNGSATYPIALAGIADALGAYGAVATHSPGVDGESIRWAGGAPAYLRNRSFYIDDKGDVDSSGASEMGGTITTYLDELRNVGNYGEVISDSGSTYLVGATPITLPAGIVWEGGNRLDYDGAATRTTIKATTGATSLVSMPESFCTLRGIELDGSNISGITLVSPSANYLMLEHCHMFRVPADGTAVKGGGLLFFSMDYCVFNQSGGRGIDLLLSHYGGVGSPYYGVNVGQITRSFFYGVSAGFIRFDGILDIRNCDFETAYPGSTGVIEVGGSANAHANIDANYFELSGTNTGSTAIYLVSEYATVSITGNTFYGPSPAPVGSAGIRFGGPAIRANIVGNEFYRWDIGISNIVASNGGTTSIDANLYSQVNTRNTFHPAQTTWALAGANTGGGMIADPKLGMVYYGGSVQGSLVYYTDPSSQSVVDLARGNVHEFQFSGSVSPTITNMRPGQQFVVKFGNANATLLNSAWHVAEGVDTAPAAGTSRQFYVDKLSQVREVGK